MIPNEVWLRHLLDHLPVARDGEDPEGVHQVRAAAGRLEVWLEMAGRSVLRADLRWLRAKASPVRDMDVLLGREPPLHPVWVRNLRERRVTARAELLGALDDPRTGALLEALALLPPASRDRGIQVAARYARKTRKRGRALNGAAGDLEDYHRLRRALRRLRFVLEWLGHKPKPLKDLQTAFGHLNDCAVALNYFASCPDKEEIPEEYGHALAADLLRHRKAALEAWHDHAAELEKSFPW